MTSTTENKLVLPPADPDFFIDVAGEEAAFLMLLPNTPWRGNRTVRIAQENDIGAAMQLGGAAGDPFTGIRHFRSTADWREFSLCVGPDHKPHDLVGYLSGGLHLVRDEDSKIRDEDDPAPARAHTLHIRLDAIFIDADYRHEKYAVALASGFLLLVQSLIDTLESEAQKRGGGFSLDIDMDYEIHPEAGQWIADRITGYFDVLAEDWDRKGICGLEFHNEGGV